MNYNAIQRLAETEQNQMNGWKCPNCHNANNDTQSYCAYCNTIRNQIKQEQA